MRTLTALLILATASTARAEDLPPPPPPPIVAMPPPPPAAIPLPPPPVNQGADTPKAEAKPEPKPEARDPKDPMGGAPIRVQAAPQVVEAKKEPSLDLPIGLYIATGAVAGVATGLVFVAGGAEKQLLNPDAHPTREETQSLYRRAYVGGIFYKGLFAASGALGAYAAWKTQVALKDYAVAKAGLALSATPEGAAVAVAGSF